MKKANKSPRPVVHFVPSELLQPYNPVTVNLIGAGGTGGQMLTALARINHSLIALGHAGLFVRLFDDDKVDRANLGRQLFTTAELGDHKAVALINRVNRFFGTNWKAHTEKFDAESAGNDDAFAATLTITCVDTVSARLEIAGILANQSKRHRGRGRPTYWMDFGNSRSSGQVILSTLDKVRQPESEQFATAEKLPLVTDEFSTLFKDADLNDDTPSCSLAEALSKQDLFINSALANCGASLLWQLFREGVLYYRGFFMNLQEYTTQPVKVT
ncbi:PRTRC system ThiF family protein [Mucilaginibacter conchicola]|uniref:PRTRC system ThiF family protein n=1 Tax=Mucilaginibacter conchicola TaxID=2303333 RepID=A0A372NMT2_9SPHI|nr:PRTRC system ThiF family protein [Mucilaginibacter conchicola]RFZ90261.1 PRTRC system ThiF family protein [Mucilaginibacter conchicola]